MIRWGILGLGKAAHSFAEAIKEVENAELVSIASLTKKKLKFFGEKFNINHVNRFSTYEELIDSKDIDAIYIATLNNNHAQLTIKSAEANKSILCEKPMALNENEANNVYSKIIEKNVLYLEAIAYRAHPQTIIINDLIKEGQIGQVENIKSSFGFSASNFIKFIPKHRLFSKQLGGGAILDVGCYPTSFSLLIARLLQKKDQELKYDLTCIKGKINFRGTEDSAYTKIIFKDQFEAELDIAITKKKENSIVINGTKGKILIKKPWLPNKETFIEVFLKSKKYEKKVISKYSIYANCIKYMSDLMMKKETKCEFPIMTLEDSIINMKILSKWKNLLNESLHN